MRFDSIAVVTYGRSGSTLLQGVLNTIPGVLVRGENNAFIRGIYESYRRLTEAKGFPFIEGSHDTTHAWYGIHEINISEFLRTCTDLVRDALVPEHLRHSTECYGFKEVRYLDIVDELHEYLAFLRLIMGRLAIVFNFRNHNDTIASALLCNWLGEDKAEEVRLAMQVFEAKACIYQRMHPDHSFIINYDDIASCSRKIYNLFDFLGAEYVEAAIRSVLAKTHSTRTQMRSPGPNGSGASNEYA